MTHINSALVSAQNRERFYVTNFGDIEQPQDRGILLRDVLESGRDLSSREKSYTLTASYDGAVAWNTLGRSQRTMVCYRIGTIESAAKTQKHDSKPYRVYSPDGKATTLYGQGGGVGAKTGLYATPVKLADIGSGGQGNRLYSTEGKAVAQSASSGGMGSNTGLYAIPAGFARADNTPTYEVRDGLITIKDRQYRVKLQDGYYLIRKLTPIECERLQTMPDGYTAVVSNSQRYKALGNGWTAEVIIHILGHALKGVPREEELVVLSMYDGIATGRYCLDKMGFKNIRYYAYEIDPYAKKIAMSNYPDIVQCGDAFQVREDDWKI